MAAKVNTRFLLIVGLVIGLALAALAGVYVLKLRGDATRSYRKGLEALNRADYKVAVDQFGRAISKDPGNPLYLEAATNALLRLTPATADEAVEHYRKYLSLLGHKALHDPANASSHLLPLREMHEWARTTNMRGAWESVLATADNMQLRVADGDPLKPLAAVYRAVAIGYLAQSESDDAIRQSIEDLDKAMASLGEAAGDQPSPGGQASSSPIDLAAAASITSRMSMIDKMTVSGASQTSIQAQQESLAAAAAKAIERAPQGPETARAYLAWRLAENSRIRSAISGQSTSASDVQASFEEVYAAAEHLAKSISPANSPGLVNEAAALLASIPDDPSAPGAQRSATFRRQAIALLEAASKQPIGAAHGSATDAQSPAIARQDHLLGLARLRFAEDQIEPARAIIEQALGAEPMTVSLAALQQFGMQQQAAAMLGDLEFRRWEVAMAKQTATDDASRAALIQSLSAARDRLAALVPDASNNLMLTRADGKIAFAKGDFAAAAKAFERLVRETDSLDPEMLAFDAASLERIGQLGLAHERISSALQLIPSNTNWIVTKASLELRMGQNAQAAQTVQGLPDTALADPRTLQVVSMARRAAASGTPGATAGNVVAPPATTDPVQAAINAAQEAVDKNEIESARAVLLGALQQQGELVPLLATLAQVEIRGGNREAALPFIERGLKLEPNNALLNQLNAGIRFDDPIQATNEFYRGTMTDEKTRLAASLIAFANLAINQTEEAGRQERRGNASAATQASALAARAFAEADRVAAELAKVNPDSPELLEFQFSHAVANKNWAAAAQVLANVKRLDLDRAGGSLFEGRLQLAQGNTQAAIDALELATDRLSFSSYAWRALAHAYQADNNFAQAERAFEQAYRCNPNDISNARSYLGLLARRGDKTRALQILQSVHSLAPQDVGLRESWLSLEADVGDKAVVLRERSNLYAVNPADRDNAIALAMLLTTLEPTQQTILNAQGLPEFSEQRWAGMGVAEQELAASDTRTRWDEGVQEIITQLATALGDDLRLAVLRATVLREQGDLLGGETVLRDFIAQRDRAQQTEDMYAELGRYQARISHFSDAVDSLKQAVALAGPKQREAEISLGVLLMQLRRYEEAVQVLESAQARADDPNTRLQIVECLMNLQRFDDAEKRLAEVSTGSGGSVVTLLSASIARARGIALVAAGKVADAEPLFAQQRQLLAKAEQQDPTNPLPRVLLAESLIDEYNRTQKPALLDDALVALDRADSIRAGVPEVSVMRVGILKERGDYAAAIAELQRTLAVAPDNINARRELILLMVESGDMPGALAAVDQAIAKNPTIAAWHEMRAELLIRASGAPADIVAAYAAAYERAPSTAMLVRLVNAMLAGDAPNSRGVVDRLSGATSELEAEPALREAYARALVGLGNRDQAVEQLRLAYAQRVAQVKQGAAKDADIRSWYVALSGVFSGDRAGDAETLARELAGGSPGASDLAGLAGIWFRSATGGGAASANSGLSRAIELQRQAVAVCPAEDAELRAELNTQLAALLINSNELAGAAQALEVVVRLQPANADALNNLAYLKAEELGDPAGALPLVERLVQLATRNAAFLDTVGWVYYRNNDLAKARQHLMESLAIEPSADTYVHLAQVLLASGDADGAENRLVDAEKLKPAAATQQKIAALRVDIGKTRSGGAGAGG